MSKNIISPLAESCRLTPQQQLNLIIESLQDIHVILGNLQLDSDRYSYVYDSYSNLSENMTKLNESIKEE